MYQQEGESYEDCDAKDLGKESQVEMNLMLAVDIPLTNLGSASAEMILGFQ